MRCVISNDDGIDAPGLRALYSALREMADVIVVAPNREFSGAGHGAPPSRPIEVERRRDSLFGEAFAVDGGPADCARLALLELVSPRPDVLVSGINRGGNTGVDAYYSGTVAAAREAVILGCPGVAVSQAIRGELPEDWSVTCRRTRTVLERLLPAITGGRGASTLWSVNLPHLAAGERPRGVIRVPMATAPLQVQYERRRVNDARSTYRYTGRYFGRPAPAGTDVAYLFDGWITLCAVGLDASADGGGVDPADWTVE